MKPAIRCCLMALSVLHMPMLSGAVTAEIQATVDALKTKGSYEFTFTTGDMHFFDVEDCNDLIDHGLTCFANNPSSPYGIVVLPIPIEDQKKEACKTTYQPFCWETDGVTLGFPFKLQPWEAVVLIGLIPPEVAYYGLTNYLFETTYPSDFKIDPSVTEKLRCWPEGSTDRRCPIFASMGDSLNIGSIKVNDPNPDVTFNKPVAIIVTASKTVGAQVAALLEAVNFPVTNINELPGEYTTVGRDTVGAILRTAFPSDKDAYTKWRESKPFAVFKMTPKSQPSDAQLYPVPSYCMYDEVGKDEYCLTSRSATTEAQRIAQEVPNVENADFEKAQQHILDQLYVGPSPDHYTATTKLTSGVRDTGYECIRLGLNCQGDTRATYYPSSSELVALHKKTLMEAQAGIPAPPSHLATIGLSPGEYMMVVGVNHFETHTAKYSSVSIYDFERLQGIISVANVNLKGSADRFLKGTAFDKLAPYMFAWKFTRGSCGYDTFCTVVPVEGELKIAANDPVLFIERAYMDPLTGQGGSTAAIVEAKVMHVVPNGPGPQVVNKADSNNDDTKEKVCLAGEGTVDVEGYGPKSLERLRSGDRVLTETTASSFAYDPVLGHLHVLPSSEPVADLSAGVRVHAGK